MFNGGMLQLILETAPIEAEYITNVSNGVIGVQGLNHLSLLRPIQFSKVEAFFGCLTPSSIGISIALTIRSFDPNELLQLSNPFPMVVGLLVSGFKESRRVVKKLVFPL